MARLDRYLIDQQILTAAQLLEAKRAQAVYGGRLGSNLIRLGLMEIEELAAHLSDLEGVPLAPGEWLEKPEERAARVLPMQLIRRYKLLPLRLETQSIHVAMLDPGDAQQLESIATASGRQVVPYVLPEVRQLYWLELHLGIDRHPRYASVTARSRLHGPREEEDAAPSPAPHVDDDRISVEELLAEASPTEPRSAARSRVDAPRSSREVAALEEELLAAGDRDTISRLTLRIARAYSRAAALFVVREGTVTSHRGDGDALRARMVGIEVPVLTESIFARPAAVLLPFRGEPPKDGVDGRVLRIMERDDVQEVWIHPIIFRGRVVNLLYADNGPDPLAETSVAALAELCGCVSRAYERLILSRKTGNP
ncbi:MAG: hypothetical protein ACE5FL_09485 [Myxococcota bacterium]